MASETPNSEISSFIENLLNSRSRGLSIFLPLISGLNAANPDHETENQESPRSLPDRIILINPLTQSMAVIERRDSNSSTTDLDSFLNDLFSSKSGQPPASKASIDAMASVEIVGGENDDGQCVICLDEWEPGQKVREMPCKHRFHGECIEKWLKIHGSCPVCRYEMPVDEADSHKRTGEEGDGGRREIWMRFSFSGSGRRSGESDQAVSSGNDSSTSHDQMQE